MKRLEDTLHNEREVRENIINRERQAWEREVRILREALTPFYKSEQDMRRKLVEIEDRVEGNYDEQLRMKERLVAVDDASMTVERRIEDLETSRGKRRRISQQHLPEDNHPNGQLMDDARRTSSNVDDPSVYSASSRAFVSQRQYSCHLRVARTSLKRNLELDGYATVYTSCGT